MASKEERVKEKREQIMMKAKGSTGEPLVTEGRYSLELQLALNWHNVHTDAKTKRDWFRKYLLHTNSTHDGKSFSDLPDYHFGQIGVLSHIIMIGGYVSEKHKKWMSNKINELVTYKQSSSIITENQELPKTSAKPVREKYLDDCVELDTVIDEFVVNKSTNFNMKAFIAKNGINSSAAKKISSYYSNTLSELEEAIAGEDEQINEGYSCYSKAELKKFYGLVKDIVETSTQAKVARAPRAKKEKPVSVIVKDVQYIKEFPELSLVSVDVKLLHNSKEIWMYNTQSRRIFWYKADGNSSLMIKGKYIKNYSVKDSFSKTIRKPEEFFKNYVLGKAVMATTFKAINAVAGSVNGKIYPDNILLKVF